MDACKANSEVQINKKTKQNKLQSYVNVLVTMLVV